MATLTVPAQAQIPIPHNAASEFIRQQQREEALQRQMESVADEPGLQITPMPLAVDKIPDETPCFMIHAMELEGELAEKFQWALKAADRNSQRELDPALNRCLGANGINIVLGRIQNAIVEKGYITSRVTVDEQDLTQGVLKLGFTPGRIHAIRWREGSDTRINWHSALPMREGDLLNLRDLEQALEVFKRVPTTDVDIQIEPVGDTGQSDLVIYWKETFPLRLNLSIDDGGSLDTSRYQGALTVAYDNPFALSDLFYVSYNHGLGDGNDGRSKGYAVHYSVPIKGNWLLSLNASYYNYHQMIAGSSRDYDYRGTSQNMDITLTRRVYRDAIRRMNFYVSGWQRRSKNYIEDTEIQNQKRRTAGWEIGANYRQFIGNAVFNANLSYRRGTGALEALRSPLEETGEGTSRMKIYNLDASLMLPFKVGKQQFRYSNVLRVQWNDTPLIPQDQFSIGGRYTVRGFDGRNTLMGDRGWLLRNDLGWQVFTTGQELYWGLDFGSVAGQATRYQVGQNLTGTVLGLRGSMTKHVRYDVFMGTWLHKPDGFETSKWTSGFNLNVGF
ncbi:ShlB/FhaC/HecB family hemolysin secretion/activation protein [Saezia sanguinis]|uniref:ShlB/FhaC/HecB family hemolysin secretion/activation protein n=1 Tax=Saezia sanguinis TaxID=1965230 RepID=UPI0030D79A24